MAKGDRSLPVFALIPGFNTKLGAYVKAAVFATLALSYFFWSFDVIPDVLGPVVGYVDDAIVFLFAAYAIRGAINTILDKRSAFLGVRK
jgi:uncharacterized membrane protein YkvA (DUF1232 family)